MRVKMLGNDFTEKGDDFVKSLSAVRQAHGPEQSRMAALHCILALLNCVRSSSTSEYKVGILKWKDEI